MNPHYTYLLLDLLSVFFPFILSFDKKVAFYRHWKYLFPSMLIIGVFFVGWDILFTEKGIWHFNPDYITGIYIVNLPLEEVLFFVCVPYACAFIYEVLNAYIKKEVIANTRFLNLFFIAVSLFCMIVYYNKTYTIVNAGICFTVIILAAYVFKFKRMGRFYLAYFVSLIPFLICNGILTSLPIVQYNDAENMAVRIFTIPFEDVFYCLSLLLCTILLMDYFSKRSKTKFQ